MILGDREAGSVEGVQRSLAIKPGGGDEVGHRTADDILDELASVDHASIGFIRIQAETFTFASSHVPCLELREAGPVAAVIAMILAADEHLDVGIGPSPKPRLNDG
jgi:hypothetical protein